MIKIAIAIFVLIMLIATACEGKKNDNVSDIFENIRKWGDR